jgi:WD40 repeat protein
LVWRPELTKEVDLKKLVALGQPLAPQESRSFEGHKAAVRAVRFSFDGQHLLTAGDDNTVRIWDAATGRARSVLRGHSRPVLACAFSHDERSVLSAGQEGQVKLWSLLDDKEQQAPHGLVLSGHDDAILSAAFSRDGKRVITSSRDHTARVYDAANGQTAAVLKEGHDFLATRAIFFDGGRKLLTAGGDYSVRFWDVTTGTQLGSIDQSSRTAAVALSSDARWLLVARPKAQQTRPDAVGMVDDRQPAIVLWRLDARARRPQVHQFKHDRFGVGHRGTVTAVAISPDGKWLVSADDTGSGKLWYAADGSEVATLHGHTSGITDVEFLPGSDKLLSSSTDGTVVAWEVPTLKRSGAVLSHATPEHRDAYDVPVTGLAVSPDGRKVLTLSEDTHGATRESVVQLWDLAQSKMIRELCRGNDLVTSVAFADGGRAALAAGAIAVAAGPATQVHPVVRRWDLDSGREAKADGARADLDLGPRAEAIWSAIEGPDGRVLTVGGKGAALWRRGQTVAPELLFRPHSGVTAAAFSPDGAMAVTGSTDRHLKLWNLATGKSEFQLPAEHLRAVTCAEFSPTETTLLATASEDGTARLWDVRARRVLHVLDHRAGAGTVNAVRSCVFSPDGKTLLTACDDSQVRTWDTASGKLVATGVLSGPVLSVAFSADGGRIIAGDANGRAMILDADSLKPRLRYVGHTDAISSVAFSPDGHRALTGSRDRSAKLWDTVVDETTAAGEAAAEGDEILDGKEVLTLRYHERGVTAVSFSPDGHSLLTAGMDGVAVVWTADDWTEPAAK